MIPSSNRTRKGPRVRIGCSGWNYKSWRGPFYPTELPASEWLRYYSERFDTVEINSSFYRLPERSVFAAWRRQVSSEFVFAVKASRFLTHMKRLRDPENPIARLFSRASALGTKLGPALYQLPPSMGFDLERLNRFLATLPRRIPHVVEFRDPSWYVAPTFACLEQHHVALCLHDKDGSAIARPFVGPFVYVRFHGTSGRYHGSYTDEMLAGWARRLSTAARRGRDVYAYFNNDPEAEATRNAVTLRAQTARLLFRADRRSSVG
jgi:uncharacterized protein YecE (DUF72 family)